MNQQDFLTKSPRLLKSVPDILATLGGLPGLTVRDGPASLSRRGDNRLTGIVGARTGESHR